MSLNVRRCVELRCLVESISGGYFNRLIRLSTTDASDLNAVTLSSESIRLIKQLTYGSGLLLAASTALVGALESSARR